MAVPDSIKTKLKRMAAQEAADSFESGSARAAKEDPSDEGEVDEDAATEMCCPKCGHTGPSEEFEQDNADDEEGDDG